MASNAHARLGRSTCSERSTVSDRRRTQTTQPRSGAIRWQSIPDFHSQLQPNVHFASRTIAPRPDDAATPTTIRFIWRCVLICIVVQCPFDEPTPSDVNAEVVVVQQQRHEQQVQVVDDEQQRQLSRPRQGSNTEQDSGAELTHSLEQRWIFGRQGRRRSIGLVT